MNWSDQHAANLAALFKSTPVLAALDQLKPDYKGGTLEDKAMSASVREGYEQCIKELAALAQQVAPIAPRSPFIPNLDQFEQRPPPPEQ